jgi:hypothetical protein
MSSLAAPDAGQLVAAAQLRAALVGPREWVEACRPSLAEETLELRCFIADPEDWRQTPAALGGFRPAVTIVLDPLSLPAELLGELPGLRLGVLVGGLPDEEQAGALDALDRIVTFRPSLTGAQAGAGRVWRAIPPPVADRFFGAVRPLHRAARAMAIGRSTPHREAMLMPAKHHHDLLQAISGLGGELLGEMLESYDVGVYVPPREHAGFGLQVALHLAAGQLLLAAPLSPAQGLERDIDYLQFDSPDGLIWTLDRLARFPEMHQRVRVRGRIKAEQFRASRVLRRLTEDLLADVRAFGRELPAATDVPA